MLNLLDICMSSLEKLAIQVLFFELCFFLFVIPLRVSLYILDINFLSNVWLANYFSIFFFFFADPYGLIPQSGIDLGPWQWKHQILTT